MVQFTLSRLIKEVDNFYQQATQAHLQALAQSKGFSMPDDPEDEEGGESGRPDLGKYDDMLQMARRVGDPSLASELELLAAMYKEAIEMGSGYNSVNRAISNLINIYMEDEDEEDSGVEDLLNEVSKDLRQRAGGAANLSKPDSPAVMARLKALKDEFNSRNLEEEVDDLSKYEEGAVAVFDPTAGMGREEAEKGAGRGWHTVSGKRKDWAAAYNNERERYIDMLASEKNPVIADKLKKLIDILGQLSDQIEYVNNLAGAQSTAPDPETEAKLEAAREELSKLRNSRTMLKNSIRNHELNVNKTKLEAELSKTRDPRDQIRLQQELALQNLMLSTDYKKGPELNWRRVLLKSMSGGNWPSQELFNKLMNNIDEASKLRVSREEHNRQVAKQVFDAKRSIRLDPNKRKNVYNWAAMQLDGFITHLSQNILAARKTMKDKILGTKNKKVSEAEKALFKPYMDAVADAANKKDRAALLTATRALREKIKESIRLSPEFSQYLISVRSSKFLYNYRDRIKFLHKLGTEGRTELNEQEVQYIEDTIEMGKRLASYYQNLKIQPIKGVPYPSGYKAAAETIQKINSYLESFLTSKESPGKVEKIDPLTGEVTYE